VSTLTGWEEGKGCLNPCSQTLLDHPAHKQHALQMVHQDSPLVYNIMASAAACCSAVSGGGGGLLRATSFTRMNTLPPSPLHAAAHEHILLSVVAHLSWRKDCSEAQPLPCQVHAVAEACYEPACSQLMCGTDTMLQG
jgi:hypothetical protein